MVLLPQPLGPRSATNSRSPTASETLSSASTGRPRAGRYSWLTRSMTICAAPFKEDHHGDTEDTEEKFLIDVVPAKAGTHTATVSGADEWVPDFAGTTVLR